MCDICDQRAIDRRKFLALAGLSLAAGGVLLGAGRAAADRLRRATLPIQLVTACLVVVLGVVLTGQALTQVL